MINAMKYESFLLTVFGIIDMDSGLLGSKKDYILYQM